MYLPVGVRKIAKREDSLGSLFSFPKPGACVSVCVHLLFEGVNRSRCASNFQLSLLPSVALLKILHSLCLNVDNDRGVQV